VAVTRGVPSVRRERLSAAERRARILDAARDVFEEHGVAGARTRQIAEGAGVNEAMLYRHFTSKEQIFEQAVMEPLDKLISKVCDIGIKLPSFDEQGKAQRDLTQIYVAELIRTFMDIAPFIGTVLSRDRSVYDRTMGRLNVSIGDVVQKASSTWPHRRFDAKLVTLLVTGTCLALALDRKPGDLTVDPGVIAEELINLIFYGISSQPYDPLPVEE
jgi:AcrR family transcriptional regulator